MPIIFRVFTMVPVMVLWGCKNVFYKTEIDPGICVNEHRMDGDENNVNVKNCGGKAKNIERNKCHCPGKKYVDEMGPATRQPIHIVGRMMNGMETP